MHHASPTPPGPLGFHHLTPDAVLGALEAVGLWGDGRLLQLNSYENRVFQVHLEDGRVVVAKFYRPGRWSDAQIEEEHAWALELAAQELPVVAPMALTLRPGAEDGLRLGRGGTLLLGPPTAQGEPTYRMAVSPRHAGRAPELEDPQVLQWMGRFLARLHLNGQRQRFAHRRSLGVQATGGAAREWLLTHRQVTPAESAAWTQASPQALALAQAAWDRVAPQRLGRVHGDCHLGNVLWRDEGPHVVDLDDAMNGPAVQDLWMLLAGTEEENEWRLQHLLAGYEQLRDFDRAELGLVEPLRTVRLLHHAAWVAQRWTDPAFPMAFTHFGTPAYWSQHTTQLREQIEKMGNGAEG